MKELITTAGLGRAGLDTLVASALEFRDALDSGATIRQVLARRCVANVFFEPSTRTRLSFDLAARRLGADVITFHAATSSVTKGESLRDTMATVTAIGADIVVVRHPQDGVPASVGEWTGVPVVNAGDGTNEHPTQALLDVVTLKRHFGALSGIRVGVVGDIVHSRVATSLIGALRPVDAEVHLIGPPEWLPDDSPADVHERLDPILADLDVVYLLRVQTERGGIINDAYIDHFQLNRDRAARLAPDAMIMHPGPMNRGVEIADEVADSPRSLVIEQVRNGVPTRMAVFSALAEARL